MSYPHQPIDQRLQRERTEAVRREYAAEDDGSFDRAIEELDRTEARKREESSILMTAGGQKSEKRNGIRI